MPLEFSRISEGIKESILRSSLVFLLEEATDWIYPGEVISEENKAFSAFDIKLSQSTSSSVFNSTRRTR